MKAFCSALVLGISALFLFGCAGGAGADRTSLLTQAARNGFVQPYAPNAAWPLALVRAGTSVKPALVVIESDGAAFLIDGTPSSDPTPLDPVGYHLAAALAAAQPDRTVLYVARPCQYLSLAELRSCPANLWLMDRFGREAQQSVANAIQQQLGGRPLILIGISGGGVIAAHLATQLGNTQQLITVAAPLALNRWAQHHNVTRYAPTDDPIAQAQYLVRLPQLHLAGGRDSIVPPHIVYEFAEAARGSRQTLQGTRHTNMWRAAIPAIRERLGD